MADTIQDLKDRLVLARKDMGDLLRIIQPGLSRDRAEQISDEFTFKMKQWS